LSENQSTTETQSTQRLHREDLWKIVAIKKKENEK
jgi:hypothetical protein